MMSWDPLFEKLLLAYVIIILIMYDNFNDITKLVLGGPTRHGRVFILQKGVMVDNNKVDVHNIPVEIDLALSSFLVTFQLKMFVCKDISAMMVNINRHMRIMPQAHTLLAFVLLCPFCNINNMSLLGIVKYIFGLLTLYYHESWEKKSL